MALAWFFRKLLKALLSQSRQTILYPYDEEPIFRVVKIAGNKPRRQWRWRNQSNDREKECVHFNGCAEACPVPGTITLRIPLSVMLVN
jgi:formate hydrogenlyase subunit 6/NADH:ubiquinone oxidoreductase subunit I